MEATFEGGPLDGETVQVGPSALKVIDVFEDEDGNHQMWKPTDKFTGNKWRYDRDIEVIYDTQETVDPETLEVLVTEVEVERKTVYRGSQYAKKEARIAAQAWTAVGPVRIWNGGAVDLPYYRTKLGAELANGWKIVWNQ